jgi:hypothetical protein
VWGWRIIRKGVKQKTAIAIGLVLLVIAIAFFVDSLPYPQPKQSEIDLKGLIPIRASIPVQSNGFAILVQAGGLLTVSGNEPILLNYTNWNGAYLDTAPIIGV